MSDDIDYLIELHGVYDGWSIKVLTDGTQVNRWENPDNPGHPREGYERRYLLTARAMSA